MIEAKEPKQSFEATYLEATRQFMPVQIDCLVGGTRKPTVGEEVDQVVSDIHDDIG